MRISIFRSARWGVLSAFGLALLACQSKQLDPEDEVFSAPSDLACGPKRFTCIDRSVITIWWVCDGTPDCLLGEDEEGCPNKCPMPDLDEIGPAEPGTCEGTALKLNECQMLDEPVLTACWDDQQASKCQLGCYMEASCRELYDNICTPIVAPELDRCLIECSARPFVCENGARIPSGWECDGEPDCVSGEDEAGCPSFTCDTGGVIPADWVCDGVPDCFGGEDEFNCTSLNCPPIQ